MDTGGAFERVLRPNLLAGDEGDAGERVLRPNFIFGTGEADDGEEGERVLRPNTFGGDWFDDDAAVVVFALFGRIGPPYASAALWSAAAAPRTTGLGSEANAPGRREIGRISGPTSPTRVSRVSSRPSACPRKLPPWGGSRSHPCADEEAPMEGPFDWPRPFQYSRRASLSSAAASLAFARASARLADSARLAFLTSTASFIAGASPALVSRAAAAPRGLPLLPGD